MKFIMPHVKPKVRKTEDSLHHAFKMAVGVGTIPHIISLGISTLTRHL